MSVLTALACAATASTPSDPKRYLSHPLYHHIYKEHDVYANLTMRPLQLDGWGSMRALYERMLTRMRPKLVVEVGVWKGLSTGQFATTLRKNGKGVVLAVDTWLGAYEMWDRPRWDTDRGAYTSKRTLHVRICTLHIGKRTLHIRILTLHGPLR